MAGVDKEIEGEAIPMPGLNIGYLPQEPQLDPEQTVRECVEAGMGDVFAAKARLEEVYAAYGEPDADFDELAAEQAELEAIIASAGTDSEHQLEIAADALRLPPWDAKIGVLSGGEKRRVALCRLLLSKPDMLLLDEPTNHLDAESVDWLEQFLQRYPGTVVAITHDRYFLDNAAEWILELDRGSGIPYKGNYSDWLEQKSRRAWSRSKKARKSRAKALKKELEWSRQNPKARQAKSKARLARFEELSATSNTRSATRPMKSSSRWPSAWAMKSSSSSTSASRFGDRVLIDNLSFKVPAGAIVGIIGPNGAGKSTLFKHDCRQGKARQRRSQDRLRPSRWPLWTSTATTCRTRKPCGKTSRAGWTSSTSANSRWPAAPTAAASTSTAATSKSASAPCPAASAAACTWPRP